MLCSTMAVNSLSLEDIVESRNSLLSLLFSHLLCFQIILMLCDCTFLDAIATLASYRGLLILFVMLRSKEFYKEERARARHLNRRSSVNDEEMNDLNSKIYYGRCNSNYDHHQHEEYGFASFGKKPNALDGNERDNQVHENKETKLPQNNPKLGEEDNIILVLI
ncbi:hypothetical protein S83_057960 [Arachis hypogaea]|nr:uncharacterized protein DS421_17g575980 [Arachis hypogaea]